MALRRERTEACEREVLGKTSKWKCLAYGNEPTIDSNGCLETGCRAEECVKKAKIEMETEAGRKANTWCTCIDSKHPGTKPVVRPFFTLSNASLGRIKVDPTTGNP